MAERISRLTLEVLNRKARLRDRALATALTAWSRTVAAPTDEDLLRFLEAYADIHPASQVAVAALVDSYLTIWLDINGYEPQGALDPSDYANPRRVEPDELLSRPMVTVRTALAEGATLSQALAQGTNRLRSIVATDMQQAYRVAFHDRLTLEADLARELNRDFAVSGYRRVLRGATNCVLCIVASTQTYKRARLMPIHPGCDCGVEPLVEGADGSDLPRLRQAKRIIRERGIAYTDRAGMANLQVDVDGLDDIDEIPHGELGPILKVAKHRDTVPKWVRRDRARNTRGFVPQQ